MVSIIRDGEKYLSSKSAAEKFSYAQDYIGELCREKRAVCTKVGRSWYIREKDIEKRSGISEEEGENIKQSTDVVQIPITRDGDSDIVAEEGGDFIWVKDKQYTSSNRASRITGYSRDYIGQLIRSNRIPAHKVGSTWYIDSGALRRHKDDAARSAAKERWSRMQQTAPVNYSHDSSPLFPSIEHKNRHTSILEVLEDEVEIHPEVALPPKVTAGEKNTESSFTRVNEIPGTRSHNRVIPAVRLFVASTVATILLIVGQLVIERPVTYTRISHGVWLTKSSVETPETKELVAGVSRIFSNSF